ncbi:MAG: flagellar biosynthesis protein FlhG [Alphaproteobacteria bacterium]|nr:MAG: flagellar biosynthesis protein FlhG [Caulobacteraceae bacterium]TPW07746.1 MAG: flagellar biosynthesis protein FlhG [Alphaproteobacteria bacterium]
MAVAAKRAVASRTSKAPITAIASGKGGVGKTWLSVSLACAFGRTNRRALLVDCDIGLANVDVQLGVRPEADLSSVMRGWLELDAAVTPILGGPGRPGGFDLLPGHSGSGALAGLKLEEVHRIAQGISTLAPLYDRIILDCAAGVDANVMRFARAADRVVVVTTEDPTALTDAYAFLKLLRLAQPTAQPWIIVNLADTRASGRRVYEQLAKATESYLGIRPPLAGVICRDPRVGDSIRAQTPLCVRHPQSQAFEDVLRIAEALSE